MKQTRLVDKFEEMCIPGLSGKEQKDRNEEWSLHSSKLKNVQNLPILNIIILIFVSSIYK